MSGNQYQYQNDPTGDYFSQTNIKSDPSSSFHSNMVSAASSRSLKPILSRNDSFCKSKYPLHKKRSFTNIKEIVEAGNLHPTDGQISRGTIKLSTPVIVHKEKVRLPNKGPQIFYYDDTNPAPDHSDYPESSSHHKQHDETPAQNVVHPGQAVAVQIPTKSGTVHHPAQREWTVKETEEIYYVRQADPEIEKEFIKSVYLIVSICTMINAFIVAPFMVSVDFSRWARKNAYVGFFWFLIYVGVAVSMYFLKTLRRTYPHNIAFLGAMVLSMALTLGFLSALIQTYSIFVSLLLTVIVCALTGALSLHSKFYTSDTNVKLLFGGLAVLLCILVCGVGLLFGSMSIIQLLWALVLSQISLMYIINECHIIFSGHRIPLKEDEYFVAVILIYRDITLCFVALFNALKNFDKQEEGRL